MDAQDLVIEITKEIEDKYPEIKIEAVHYEIINECAELAMRDNDIKNTESLKLAASIACISIINILKGIQRGIKDQYGADLIVNFTYRNHKFQIKN